MSVSGKFLSMRKPQEFTIYPRKDGEMFVVQSNRAIGRFDPETGKGTINTNGNTFFHLSMLGAMVFTFPPEFVQACKDFETRMRQKGAYLADGTALIGAL